MRGCIEYLGVAWGFTRKSGCRRKPNRVVPDLPWEACDIPALVPDAGAPLPHPRSRSLFRNSALLCLLFLNKSHYMHRTKVIPKRSGVPYQPSSTYTRPSARGSGSDSDARSGATVPSPTDSVDSVFIEKFSSSNSSPDDSASGQRSSASDSESSVSYSPPSVISPLTYGNARITHSLLAAGYRVLRIERAGLQPRERQRKRSMNSPGPRPRRILPHHGNDAKQRQAWSKSSKVILTGKTL